MEPSSLSDTEISKKLIQLVKDKPLLYTKDLEDFKDEAKKNEAWKCIAESLNLGVQDTLIRWARLRVDFGRHRRKRQAAEACGTQIRDWPLYGLLTWLAPHIKMRGKRLRRKREKIVNVNPEIYGYKPILPRPDWLTNVERSVSVEVNPSIVIPNGNENFTESFIVSPDTADYDEDASIETVQQSSIKKEDFDTDKLSALEIKNFVEDHELELSQYLEEMRSALKEQNRNGTYLFSLESSIFSWKKILSGGLVVKLGQIKVKCVPLIETYAEILDRSLEELFTLQDQVAKLKEENCSLRKDRIIALEKVKEFAAQKEDWERTLYGRFVAVLNSKKDRIRDLQEELNCRVTSADTSTGHKAPVEPAAEDAPEDPDEDPYGGDTDVDSDGDGEGTGPSSREVVTPSAFKLRRNRDIFDSFDSSPGSPTPVLPKRAKVLNRDHQGQSGTLTASTSASTARNILQDAIGDEQDEDDDDDMAPLTLKEEEHSQEESTQDLLDLM